MSVGTSAASCRQPIRYLLVSEGDAVEQRGVDGEKPAEGHDGVDDRVDPPRHVPVQECALEPVPALDLGVLCTRYNQTGWGRVERVCGVRLVAGMHAFFSRRTYPSPRVFMLHRTSMLRRRKSASLWCSKLLPTKSRRRMRRKRMPTIVVGTKTTTEDSRPAMKRVARSDVDVVVPNWKNSAFAVCSDESAPRWHCKRASPKMMNARAQTACTKPALLLHARIDVTYLPWMPRESRT